LQLFYLIGFVFLISISPALAHTGNGSAGLLNCISHPFSGFDHIFSMLAVGIWASQFPNLKKLIWPISFLIAMSIGTLFCLSIGPIHIVEFGIAVSIVFLVARSYLKLRYHWLTVPHYVAFLLYFTESQTD